MDKDNNKTENNKTACPIVKALYPRADGIKMPVFIFQPTSETTSQQLSDSISDTMKGIIGQFYDTIEKAGDVPHS